jgi:hypothetical protein
MSDTYVRGGCVRKLKRRSDIIGLNQCQPEQSSWKSLRHLAQEAGVQSFKFPVFKMNECLHFMRCKECVHYNNFWHMLWSVWVLFVLCWPMGLPTVLQVQSHAGRVDVTSLPLSLSFVGLAGQFAANLQVTSLYIECTNAHLRLTIGTHTTCGSAIGTNNLWCVQGCASPRCLKYSVLKSILKEQQLLGLERISIVICFECNSHCVIKVKKKK